MKRKKTSALSITFCPGVEASLCRERCEQMSVSSSKGEKRMAVCACSMVGKQSPSLSISGEEKKKFVYLFRASGLTSITKKSILASFKRASHGVLGEGGRPGTFAAEGGRSLALCLVCSDEFLTEGGGKFVAAWIAADSRGETIRPDGHRSFCPLLRF